MTTPAPPHVRATQCRACGGIVIAMVYGDPPFACEMCGSDQAGASKDTALESLLRKERRRCLRCRRRFDSTLPPRCCPKCKSPYWSRPRGQRRGRPPKAQA